MSDSIYKSSTHGPIPLSFTGKRLLQNLREEAAKAITEGKWREQLSYTRGELAKYMSDLEHRAKPVVDAAMTATEATIRQEAERTKPFRSYFDWPTSGYAKLLDDIRKNIDREANSAMYDAMLYGTSKPWIMKAIGTIAEITGNRANLVVIDDPQNEQELDMSKKAVATCKRAEKVQAAKAAKFQPVGIRFLHGTSLATIYTYKAKRAAKLTLGQEVVVRNERGTNVGVVVSLDGAIPNGWVLDTLTELTHTVAAL